MSIKRILVLSFLAGCFTGCATDNLTPKQRQDLQIYNSRMNSDPAFRKQQSKSRDAIGRELFLECIRTNALPNPSDCLRYL